MNSVKSFCDICNQSVTKPNFARHVVSHNSVIQCEYCPIIFNRKDNYKRLLKLHGDRKPDDIGSGAPATLEVDDAKVKDSIINFHVDPPSKSVNSRTADFVHPFSCKIMGPRGSGKTSFTVSYIQQVASLTFAKIYIVTASADQPLYSQLKDNCQILFISLD